MQLYHGTDYTFQVHFLIHNAILSKCDMCGLIVAGEAAGGFFLKANQSCPAGRAVGPASCSFSSRVTFSQD